MRGYRHSTKGRVPQYVYARGCIGVMKHQRTLFDFARPSTSSIHLTDATDSNSEDEESSQPKRRVSGQINTVRVDRAQGGTTIIINNSSGGSHVNSSPTPSPTPTELEQS